MSRDWIQALEPVTSAFRQCRAKTVVDVGVRPVIVQIQIEHAGIGTVTPIAATDSTLTTPPPGRLFVFLSLNPSAYHTTDLIIHSGPYLVFLRWEVAQIKSQPHI